MRPNSRETTACRVCGEPIFFALTRNGERQALDVAEQPDGSVMAYRGLRHWLARTLPRARPEQAGEQLELGEVAELVDDPREHPPHPLERRFRVHAASCAGAPPVQTTLFDDGRPDQGRPVATVASAVPAPRRPADGRPTPDLQRKVGRTAQPAAERGSDAQVFDWATAAPRIAARRRTARPAAGQ